MPLSFVDLDLQDEAVKAGRMTGDTGRKVYAAAAVPLFRDAIQTIPRSQWESLIKAHVYNGCESLITRIYDQNGDPSCTSNATCQAHEITQAKQYGKDRVVHLSAISLYMRVGSPRSGSSVDDNLEEIADRGILPLDNDANRARFAHVMRANGYRRDYPNDWTRTANAFRAHEWFDIRSVDQFFTALLLGMPVVYGRSGHAICAVRAVLDGNTLYAKYANSWGSWGDKGGDFNSGFGYDSERMVRAGASWAFALRSATLPDWVLTAA